MKFEPQRPRRLLKLTVFVTWPIMVWVAEAQDIAVPSPAPLNPLFVEYMRLRQAGLVSNTLDEDGHMLGLIPSPLDFSHLRNQPSPLTVTADVPPLGYDLREFGRVTSVKDQGICGTCWAFATFGSLESALAPGETYDFSENNMKNLHGFDSNPCVPGGGNFNFSMAYLSRWLGPVNESHDPYQQNNESSSPRGLATQKHLQDAILIPARANLLDNDALKNGVMTYGGLYVTLYWDSAAYNSTTASYYTGYSATPNHSVTLVGWNDSHSKANFNLTPPADGAFLLKNNWGSEWGQSGYFWISYYDTNFATAEPAVAFMGNEPPTNYARLYEYDPLGWVGKYGYPKSTTGWFANVFTALNAEELRAVSTYVASNSSSYTVKIYTGVTGSKPTNGSLAGEISGTFALAGYHTVALPVAVPLTAGEKFSVVVSLTTPGDYYPIPVEYAYALSFSSGATASPGQSYISSNGNAWTDTTTENGTMNVALKAFSGPATVKKRSGQTISQ